MKNLQFLRTYFFWKKSVLDSYTIEGKSLIKKMQFLNVITTGELLFM